MNEEWKDIKGYEGLYQVSNFGRVKSFQTGSDYILNQVKDWDGYMQLQLYKNNKPTTCKIHRLVANAFIPNPENKPQVNHIDEDKTNNMVSNLEWATAKENCNHGTHNERISKPVKAIDIANGEWNEYYSTRECARQLSIDHSSITKQLKGKLRRVGGYIFEYVN